MHGGVRGPDRGVLDGNTRKQGVQARFVELAAPVVDAAKEAQDPVFAESVVASYETGVAHSPTVLVGSDGPRVIWFRGSSEGARDVALFESRLEEGVWTAPRRITDASAEQEERSSYVKTIGNPVLYSSPDGRDWLAYVTPVLSGWSSSKVSLRQSTDNGLKWTEPRFLKLSPFLGLSNLVRYPALAMSDGFMGLPVYHEFLRGYSAIAVIGRNGEVVDLRRIGGAGDQGIQADLILAGNGQVETFLRPVRQMPRRLYRAESRDGGITWSAPEPTSWTNPSAPACSEQFADGAAVLMFNDDEIRRLRLVGYYREATGRGWRRLEHVFAGRERRESLSYCTFTRDEEDRIHLVYSQFSDRSIRHVVFNRAWLEQQSVRENVR